MIEFIFFKVVDIKGFSYCKIIFLYVVYFVESFCVEVGDCMKVLLYFMELSMCKVEVKSIMEGVVIVVVEKYFRKILGGMDLIFLV